METPKRKLVMMMTIENIQGREILSNLIDLKLVYYLKDSISLKNRKKALNDIDVVVKKIRKKLNFKYENL